MIFNDFYFFGPWIAVFSIWDLQKRSQEPQGVLQKHRLLHIGLGILAISYDFSRFLATPLWPSFPYRISKIAPKSFQGAAQEHRLPPALINVLEGYPPRTLATATFVQLLHLLATCNATCSISFFKTSVCVKVVCDNVLQAFKDPSLQASKSPKFQISKPLILQTSKGGRRQGPQALR